MARTKESKNTEIYSVLFWTRIVQHIETNWWIHITTLCVVFCIAYCKESAIIQDYRHYAVWLSKQKVQQFNCTLLCLVKMCCQKLHISNSKGTESMTEFCIYLCIVCAVMKINIPKFHKNNTWNFTSTPNMKFVWSDSMVCEWSHWAFLLCKLDLWYSFSKIFSPFNTWEDDPVVKFMCVYIYK